MYKDYEKIEKSLERCEQVGEFARRKQKESRHRVKGIRRRNRRF